MFSVIIPLYNKETFIARTLQSVLDQTFQEFEIIIVNDGSTDGSVKEVERFNDERIRLIQQTNAGVSTARNKGISESKYDLIAFLDADDTWLPTYLETIIKLSNKYNNCSVYATSYYIKGKGLKTPNEIKGLSFLEEGIMDDYFQIAALNLPPLWTSAITVRKNAIESVGGFPVGIKSGEDLLTWANLAARYKIAYSTSPLSIYYNDTEIWESGRPTDRVDLVGVELKKLLQIISSQYVPSLRKYLSLWHKMRASTFLRHNQRFVTLYETFLSLSYNPKNVKLYIYILLTFLPMPVIQYIFKKTGNS
jgi:glycosyltransferase involved in cell wall biosynthesis